MPPKLLIDALGAVVQIDLGNLSDAEASAVREAWRDALAPAVDIVDAPLVTPAESAGLAAMLESLSQQVTLAALGARRGELWMLHAAGVASPDGRVVVLVGPSGRGKTTASRTLAESFGYVSDESVAIESDGRIRPYRKPLSIIEQPGSPKVQRAPSDLGLRPLPDAPLRVAAIVLLDRREDADVTARIEDVDFGDALEDLVPQASYLTAMPAALHSMAELAAAAGGIRRVTYRDAASLRPVIEALFAASPDPSAPRSSSERSETKRSEPTSDSAGPRYSRAAYVDALGLADPDRLALLHAGADGTGVLHVLAGVAPAIWRAADAASVDDLAAAALAAYGTPDGDVAALVAAAVGELVSAGVLVAEQRWSIRDDVAWVDHGDRVVALALADPDATPLALEGSAASIWRALDDPQPSTASAVAQRVAEAASVAREAVMEDVTSFLETLSASSLVSSSDL